MASDIQRCVDTIGEVLGLPVSLTDPDLNSLRFSPHHEDAIDDVRRDSILLRTTATWVREWFAEYGVGRSAQPVRVEPHSDRDTMSRVVVPVRHRGLELGLVCVLDPDRSCSDEDLARIVPLVEELASLLYDDQTDRLEVSRLLHDLLTGGATAQVHALQGLQQATSMSAESTCVLVTASGISGPAPQRQPPDAKPRRRTTPHALALQAPTPTHHVFVLDADAEPVDTQVARLRHAVAGCCVPSAVGVSEPMPLRDAATAYAQARAAMSAAARLDELPDVVEYARLGALRFLATRPDAELELAIDPRVRPLLDDEDLLRTLWTYLDLSGDTAATTSRLTVHRGTLYYRLRKAEDSTGLDLARGADRLALHLGLLAHQLLASSRHPTHTGEPRLLAL